MPEKEVDNHFIDTPKLTKVLEDLQKLLFEEYGLTALERDIVLKIALRQENKMQIMKDNKKLTDLTTDLMHKAGFT